MVVSPVLPVVPVGPCAHPALGWLTRGTPSRVSWAEALDTSPQGFKGTPGFKCGCRFPCSLCFFSFQISDGGWPGCLRRLWLVLVETIRNGNPPPTHPRCSHRPPFPNPRAPWQPAQRHTRECREAESQAPSGREQEEDPQLPPLPLFAAFARPALSSFSPPCRDTEGVDQIW